MRVGLAGRQSRVANIATMPSSGTGWINALLEWLSEYTPFLVAARASGPPCGDR